MAIDPLLFVASVLLALVILAAAALRGWQGWLDLKRQELERLHPGERLPGPGAARIEIADLKERVRKLEAIAAGVDL
jgi:hypothetical protein